MKSIKRFHPIGALLVLILVVGEVQAAPLGSAVSYQGRLGSGGNSANGMYDFRFSLYDAAENGVQVGNAFTNKATGVTNGLFSVTLDFGAVFDGNARWLQIEVRTNGIGAFTLLRPRQPLEATPYALYSPSAGTAASAGSASSLTANAVTSASLQVNAVTTEKIADGTIVAADLKAADFNGTFWRASGNTGISPGTHFLGTTDNRPLEFRVQGEPALRLEPWPAGAHSLSAGRRAKAMHPGTFVWADSTDADFASSGANQFLIRATGGVGINTSYVNDNGWPATWLGGTTVIDPENRNDGTLANALVFGSPSGEGIASRRQAGANQYGLDLFQNFQARLSIAVGGNVGIGTIAPSERLEVAGAILSTGSGPAPSIRLKNTSATEWRITSYSDNKLLFWNGMNRMAIDKDGKVGINSDAPAYTLDVGGSIRGRTIIADDLFRWKSSEGTYYNLGFANNYAIWVSSDQRLKRDIEVISNAVSAVRQLRGVSFRWNDAGLRHLTRDIEQQWKSASGKLEDDQKLWAEKRAERYQELAKTQRGFIAQEVERVFPEWVSTDPETGRKQIDMRSLDAVLVNAIKEQQEQIEAQDRRIHALEERLQALERASTGVDTNAKASPLREWGCW